MDESIELKKLRIHENRIKILNEMQIFTIKDLLLHFPYRYEIIEETPLEHDQKVTLEGVLVEAPKVFFKGRLSRLSFSIMHDQVTYKITVFNRHFLMKNMTVGMPITVIGKYNEKTKAIMASDVKLKPLSMLTGIEPVYSLKEGMTQKSFQGYIKKALAYFKGHLEDEVPMALMIKHQLIHKELAIQLIHNPGSQEDLRQALRYLKYEEFLKFQLTMKIIKLSHTASKGVSKDFDKAKVEIFIKKLPFTLTKDQNIAYQEVLADLQEDKMMYRFVQGDVGSGKTVVCAIGMYANYLAGYQGALMAPTEILATQHYHSLCTLFKDFDLRIELLTGHVTAKAKHDIYDRLKANEIDIIVGTHALFQDKVEYANLGFVVTDEQHRFGVNQRKALKDKGNQVDFLVMSATPIPRTLAISLYGDMDVSTIKTMPVGRKPVITSVIKSKSMKPILKQLKEYLLTGGQCYVVCPLIEENEVIKSSDATSIYQAMSNYFKGQYEVGLLHGQMDDQTKETIMKEFQENKIQILVSTTVIEVGVDVENANMMVIYNAERFGLSQLHQLRGRIGRGDKQGYCYLLTSTSTPEAMQRLEFLKDCNDGFEISRYDLQLRGPGDILGDKQSGLPVFIVGDIFKDANILEVARRDAIELLTNKSNDLVYIKLLQQIEAHLLKNNQYVD